MSVQGKTVLVTGGTGFLGGALALRLARDGARVRVLARTPTKGDWLREQFPAIEVVEGDVTRPDTLPPAMQGCDIVFHVAASFADWDAQRAINTMGTRNVAEAAADAGVKRLVHVSSIAVYGLLVRGRVTEDHPLSAGGSIAYNVTKADGERMLLDVAARRGLDYSIIRPGMIYGPKSEPWTLRMFRLARRSPLVFIGDGSGSAHPIHVDDVVALTVLLATHPAASGEAFNCSADPAPTFREFLGGYMRLAGHERWLGIPRLPALLLASLIARFAPKASMVRDAPDALRLFTKPGVIYSTEKARRLLGWQPKIELAEGIAGTASYLREKGLLQ